MNNKKMPKTHQVMMFLRENPHATNDDVAREMGFTNKGAANYVSLLNVRGWINSVYTDGKRTIEVVWKESESQTIKDFRKDAYYEMLPNALETYEEATNVQDLNVAAKIVFRILENL